MVEYLDKIGLTYLWGKLKTLLNGKVDKVSSTDNAVPRFDGTDGKIQNSGVKIGDDNNVIFPSIYRDNYHAYNVANFRLSSQCSHVVFYTNLLFRNQTIMPVVTLKGFVYSNYDIESKITFYIYNNKFHLPHVQNLGAYNPNVYLFVYGDNKIAIGLEGSFYFFGCQADLHFPTIGDSYLPTVKWTTAYDNISYTDETPAEDRLIPVEGIDKCVKVPNNKLATTTTGNYAIVEGGTASQFLKADGSVDGTAYLPVNGNAASATKATQDGNGDNIEATYQKKADVPASITGEEMDSVLEDNTEVETTETNNE